jgi:hypothetical protein
MLASAQSESRAGDTFWLADLLQELLVPAHNVILMFLGVYQSIHSYSSPTFFTSRLTCIHFLQLCTLLVVVSFPFVHFRKLFQRPLRQVDTLRVPHYASHLYQFSSDSKWLIRIRVEIRLRRHITRKPLAML